jgi:DNA polymerase III subunit chi
VAEIRFYHLTLKSLEDVLPVMLERTVVRDGRRAVVVAGSPERVEKMNAHLWTYSDSVFLPHGSKTDGHAAQQPVWLTDTDENPNEAKVLFLVDGGVSENVATYDLVCELFDGRNDKAVAAARHRWKTYKDGDHALTYWQQTERGGWEQKAEG